VDKKGHRSPVASPGAFVGRRREIQTGLKALRAQEHAGILIHGMGRLGKSSLAARLAGRLGDDFALAVVFGDYDAFSVFQALYEAVDRYKAARELLDAERERVLKDPEALGRRERPRPPAVFAEEGSPPAYLERPPSPRAGQQAKPQRRSSRGRGMKNVELVRWS
jgi:AAA ATPase domain